MDYVVTGWNALGAPAGTPPAIVDLLHKRIAEVVAMPEIKEKFTALGSEARSSTPQELAARLAADIGKWTEVIKQAGIEQQ